MAVGPAGSRGIGRLAPLLLLVAGSATGLALGEALVRLTDPHVRDHVIPSGFFVIDPLLGWRQQSSHSVTHDTRHFTVAYATNSRGYRDPPRPAGRTNRRTRILLFGDSQVFGWGVPQGRRFTDLLNARFPALEVWNLGVIATGLDQQLLAYERDGGAWEADVAAFFVSEETLRRMRLATYARKPKPRFVLDSAGALRLEPVSGSATAATAAAYRLLSGLYLPYFLERRAAVAAGMLRREAGGRRGGRTAEPARVDSLARGVLTRTAALARRRGHRLLLVAALPRPALDSLRAAAGSLGAGLIALSIPRDSAYIFSTDDPHWNARAHDLAARQFGQQWHAMADPGLTPPGTVPRPSGIAPPPAP